jgi:hypothetical protein
MLNGVVPSLSSRVTLVLEGTQWATVLTQHRPAIITALYDIILRTFGLPQNNVTVEDISIGSLRIVFILERSVSTPVSDASLQILLHDAIVVAPLLDLYSTTTGAVSSGTTNVGVVALGTWPEASPATVCGAGCIAGVVVGSVCGAAIMILALLYHYRRCWWSTRNSVRRKGGSALPSLPPTRRTTEGADGGMTVTPWWFADEAPLRHPAVSMLSVAHHGGGRESHEPITISAGASPAEAYDEPLTLVDGDSVFSRTPSWRHRMKDGTKPFHDTGEVHVDDRDELLEVADALSSNLTSREGTHEEDGHPSLCGDDDDDAWTTLFDEHHASRAALTRTYDADDEDLIDLAEKQNPHGNCLADERQDELQVKDHRPYHSLEDPFRSRTMSGVMPVGGTATHVRGQRYPPPHREAPRRVAPTALRPPLNRLGLDDSSTTSAAGADPPRTAAALLSNTFQHLRTSKVAASPLPSHNPRHASLDESVVPPPAAMGGTLQHWRSAVVVPPHPLVVPAAPRPHELAFFGMVPQLLEGRDEHRPQCDGDEHVAACEEALLASPQPPQSLQLSASASTMTGHQYIEAPTPSSSSQPTSNAQKAFMSRARAS